MSADPENEPMPGDRRFEKVANRAVKEARRTLRRTLPDLDHVFWYGAVDIDPRHLVVWVLLQGPADELPEWFFPTGDEVRDTAAAKGRSDELSAVAATVRGVFADAGWPDPHTVDVGFDSAERVAESGGWVYFK